MNDNSLELTDEHKQKIFKYAKIGIPLIACLIIAPAVFVLAQAAIGAMLALTTAAAVGLVAINMAPVFALKLANRSKEMIQQEQNQHIINVISEVEDNPIPSLKQQLADQQKELGNVREELTKFSTEVNNFKSQNEEYAKTDPDDAKMFAPQIVENEEALKFREESYSAFKAEVENFSKAIRRLENMWKMSQAAQRMNKAIHVNVRDEFETLKRNAAVDTVLTSVNRARAEMRTAMLDRPGDNKATVLKVENAPQPALQLSQVSVNKTVGVK